MKGNLALLNAFLFLFDFFSMYILCICWPPENFVNAALVLF